MQGSEDCFPRLGEAANHKRAPTWSTNWPASTLQRMKWNLLHRMREMRLGASGRAPQAEHPHRVARRCQRNTQLPAARAREGRQDRSGTWTSMHHLAHSPLQNAVAKFTRPRKVGNPVCRQFHVAKIVDCRKIMALAVLPLRAQHGSETKIIGSTQILKNTNFENKIIIVT